MSIDQITPDEAKARLDADPQNTHYLDVRSIPEFEQGHASGALNIPLLHYNPQQGMVPNNDFLNVAAKVLDKNKHYVVGCKMGGRSQRACELLEQMGFAHLANIDGGFSGNAQQAGWEALELPVEHGNGENRGYEALKNS